MHRITVSNRLQNDTNLKTFSWRSFSYKKCSEKLLTSQHGHIINVMIHSHDKWNKSFSNFFSFTKTSSCLKMLYNEVGNVTEKVKNCNTNFHQSFQVLFLTILPDIISNTFIIYFCQFYNTMNPPCPVPTVTCPFGWGWIIH